jgi:hypothetical protein
MARRYSEDIDGAQTAEEWEAQEEQWKDEVADADSRMEIARKINEACGVFEEEKSETPSPRTPEEDEWLAKEMARVSELVKARKEEK